MWLYNLALTVSPAYNSGSEREGKERERRREGKEKGERKRRKRHRKGRRKREGKTVRQRERSERERKGRGRREKGEEEGRDAPQTVWWQHISPSQVRWGQCTWSGRTLSSGRSVSLCTPAPEWPPQWTAARETPTLPSPQPH